MSDETEETENENGLSMNGDIKESSLSYNEKQRWQTQRWKNRRRISWGCFWNLTLINLLYFFAPITDSRLTIIADPLAMISFGFVGVIGAYMGFTTFEKYKMGK